MGCMVLVSLDGGHCIYITCVHLLEEVLGHTSPSSLPEIHRMMA